MAGIVGAKRLAHRRADRTVILLFGRQPSAQAKEDRSRDGGDAPLSAAR